MHKKQSYSDFFEAMPQNFPEWLSKITETLRIIGLQPNSTQMFYRCVVSQNIGPLHVFRILKYIAYNQIQWRNNKY
jgi:hypothetical protein